MGLATYLSEMAAERRTVTVYAEETDTELAEYFEHWNVEIQTRSLPAGMDDAFVTVHRGEEFLGGVDLGDLTFLTEAKLTQPGTGGRQDNPVDTFLDLLDDTLFSAVERRPLLATSREIEDRAWRGGEGVLHAAFQRPGAFTAQRRAYERLAETDLDVHVYAETEWDVEPPRDVTAHAEDSDELGAFWVVAYEKNKDGEQDCALLAKEEAPRTYTGFWTYDSERVEQIATHLRSTYW